MFIGREQELSFFEGKYNAPDGQLVVLYGRRRIGKTELLQKFCEGKPNVFYTCREITDAEQLESLSERISRAGGPAPKYSSAYRDWEAAFKSIIDIPSNDEKKLLIIDEFQYMCKGNPSIPSILQILWDELLRKQDVMIVLCGSSMSFIENSILSEKNPLYGRATGIYNMTGLPFKDAIKLFPDYSAEDKMMVYAVLGGIPHYLLQFEPGLSLGENITKNVLTKGCVLYNEVEFLMRQELREPALYNTILEAIAFGNTQLNEIHLKTRIDKSKISVYLKNLIDLQIVRREFSVLSDVKGQVVPTRGLYQINDNFFRFWFHFVCPNLSDLETGDADGIFTHAVQPQLSNYTSPVFEKVCLDFIREKNRSNELPFRVSKLGRWWGKLNMPALAENGKGKLTSVASELDVVAADDQSKNYILGECKFRNSPMDAADLGRLKEKSSLAGGNATIYYALFSKSGFTGGLVEQAKEDEYLKLYSLKDIVSSD